MFSSIPFHHNQETHEKVKSNCYAPTCLTCQLISLNFLLSLFQFKQQRNNFYQTRVSLVSAFLSFSLSELKLFKFHVESSYAFLNYVKKHETSRVWVLFLLPRFKTQLVALWNNSLTCSWCDIKIFRSNNKKFFLNFSWKAWSFSSAFFIAEGAWNWVSMRNCWRERERERISSHNGKSLSAP